MNDFAMIFKQISEIESETAAQEYTTTIWAAPWWKGRDCGSGKMKRFSAVKVTEEKFEKYLDG